METPDLQIVQITEELAVLQMPFVSRTAIFLAYPVLHFLPSIVILNTTLSARCLVIKGVTQELKN